MTTNIKPVNAPVPRPAMTDQRRALQPVNGCEFPPGRTHLRWGWWEKDDWLPGSGVSWREQWQRKRAQLRAEGRVNRRYDPDRNLRAKLRSFAMHRWTLAHDHGEPLPPEWVEALDVMQ